MKYPPLNDFSTRYVTPSSNHTMHTMLRSHTPASTYYTVCIHHECRVESAVGCTSCGSAVYALVVATPTCHTYNAQCRSTHVLHVILNYNNAHESHEMLLNVVYTVT